jgi:hypothetical protein
VNSLLRRPRAGEATVRAVLAAAHDAVAKHQASAVKPVGPAAAVRRLLDELDERDRFMVAARLWAQRPLPQGVVAQQLGVTKAWVNRNQPRATAKFAELLADPTHEEVGEHAAELARRLGPYTPADAVAAELRRLGQEAHPPKGNHSCPKSTTHSPGTSSIPPTAGPDSCGSGRNYEPGQWHTTHAQPARLSTHLPNRRCA